MILNKQYLPCQPHCLLLYKYQCWTQLYRQTGLTGACCPSGLPRACLHIYSWVSNGYLGGTPSRSLTISGLICTILSMVVLTISSVLVVKKYKASDKSLERQLQEEG